MALLFICLGTQAQKHNIWHWPCPGLDLTAVHLLPSIKSPSAYAALLHVSAGHLN
jgi:hypothetical protein